MGVRRAPRPDVLTVSYGVTTWKNCCGTSMGSAWGEALSTRGDGVVS